VDVPGVPFVSTRIRVAPRSGASALSEKMNRVMSSRNDDRDRSTPRTSPGRAPNQCPPGQRSAAQQGGRGDDLLGGVSGVVGEHHEVRPALLVVMAR
jgi:hypothetical protein